MMSCSRRLALAAVILLSSATAVSAAAATTVPAAEDAEATVDGGTRTVETYFGPVEIPVDPQTIVALDEYSALGLLSVGGTPAHVIASYQSVVGRVILENAGVDVVDGGMEGGYNFELISSWEPDLIVLTQDVMTDELNETLSEIAPTVMLPYVAPWRDVIETYGEVFDEPERTGALIAALERRIAEVAELTPHAHDGDGAPTMSILANTMGMMFAPSIEAPIATVLDELGWAQPPAQVAGVPDPTFLMAIMISSEQLADHDADVVVVLGGNLYYNAEAVTSLPTFQALPAVADGRVYEVDGDMWFGTYPFAIYWALEDIALIAEGADADAMGSTDDTAARWEAFAALSA